MVHSKMVIHFLNNLSTTVLSSWLNTEAVSSRTTYDTGLDGVTHCSQSGMVVEMSMVVDMADTTLVQN